MSGCGAQGAHGLQVSVVLPAYDEAATIGDTVEATLDALGSFLVPGCFEVIVAEDGCTDRTPAIAARLAAADDRVRHVHSDERLGRGRALERAFRTARGETLVYFDTDLATDLDHLERLVESVRSGAYDVATGSRWLPGREADRPLGRRTASRGYNALVRLFLRSGLRDHQCGFKAIDRSVLLDLLEAVEADHWFWDTELLVRAQRSGYRVLEFPVDWEPKGDSKVDVVRDVLGMGSQVGRLWWQLGVAPRLTRRVSIASGALLSVAAIGLMTLYLDPAAVLAELGRADPALVAVATLVYLASWPFRGARYGRILDGLGYRERVGLLTGAVFISQTGNLVFPARAGDAVRAYVMKARRGIPYSTGFASLVVERVFDLATITLLASGVLGVLVAIGEGGTLAATVAAAGRPGRSALIVAVGVSVAVFATVVSLWTSARVGGNPVRRVASRVGTGPAVRELLGRLEDFVVDLRLAAGSRRAALRIGATSLGIWVLDVMTAVLVLLSLGSDVGLVTLATVGFLAVSVGNLAKVLPLSPGGIGLYEAAFTLVVAGLTPVAAPLAFGAAVLDHAVKNLVTVAGGVGSMLLLNVSLTTAVDEGATASRPTASGLS